MTRPWQETEREDRARSLRRESESLTQDMNELMIAQESAQVLGREFSLAVHKGEVTEALREQIAQERIAMREAIASYSKAIETHFDHLEAPDEH